jgi:hypothetical protein
MIEVTLESVIVPKVFCKFLSEATPLGQHQGIHLITPRIRFTTRQESTYDVRRDSIAGAKMEGLWVGLVG